MHSGTCSYQQQHPFTVTSDDEGAVAAKNGAHSLSMTGMGMMSKAAERLVHCRPCALLPTLRMALLPGCPF